MDSRKSLYSGGFIRCEVIDVHFWMLLPSLKNKAYELFKRLTFFIPICRPDFFINELVVFLVNVPKQIFQSAIFIEGLALYVEVHIAVIGFGQSFKSAAFFKRDWFMQQRILFASRQLNPGLTLFSFKRLSISTLRLLKCGCCCKRFECRKLLAL